MCIRDRQTLGCISGKESILISPIIHWMEKDVWEFLNKVMEVPHCSLYDEGWHRIGCIGCPMSSEKQKQIENIRYPHVKRNWIKAIKSIRGGGQNSFQTTTGRTSERIGCQSGTSEDCSGHRRIHQSNSYQKDIWTADATGTTLNSLHQNGGGKTNTIQQAPVHQREPTTECGTSCFLKAHRLTA